MEFEKYNTKRNAIIKKYKKQRTNNVLAVLGIGAALLGITALLANFLFNVAIGLVLGAVILMITVIFARIRFVTVTYIMDEKLRDFEGQDPNFY